MGEIVVYNVKDKDIPIVHRIVRKFGTGDKAKLLTKGDNNAADDTELCRCSTPIGIGMHSRS